MKLVLIRLLLLFILAFYLPAGLFAKELKAYYNIEIGSVNIGNLIWIVDVDENNYKTSMYLKDKGLLSGLYDFTGEYISEGKLIKDEFVSSKYSQFWKTKKKTKKVEILFDKMMVGSLVLNPKENELPRINYFNIQGLVDPLTSFINVLKNSKNNFKTIDGRRLYKMLLDFEKKEGNMVSKKIIIGEYFNIWADHKRKDLRFISTKQDLSKKNDFLPNSIKIKNKGLIFTLTRI